MVVGDVNDVFELDVEVFVRPRGEAFAGGRVTWERGEAEMPCFREAARAARTCFFGLWRGIAWEGVKFVGVVD